MVVKRKTSFGLNLGSTRAPFGGRPYLTPCHSFFASKRRAASGTKDRLQRERRYMYYRNLLQVQSKLRPSQFNLQGQILEHIQTDGASPLSVVVNDIVLLLIRKRTELP